MIEFMETLRVPEGMLLGQPLIQRPFQRHIITSVYNPVFAGTCCAVGNCRSCQANKRSCVRVVRKAVYSVGKKNGKTPTVSGLSLGHLVGPEAKGNEQIYSAAFDQPQAAITMRYMTQMILMDEELSDLLVIRESKKEIYCPKNGSLFKALSSEKKGKHGLGPAVLIMDELAQFGADRDFYDILQQGRGAHLEPLLWIISTQAADDLAVLSQEIDYGLKVESGEIVDPTVRCFLFTTPVEVDIHDPENWKASNPALGDFLNIADMEEQSRTAKNMPSAEAGFRNLRLNQRIDSSAHFISPNVWKSNGDGPDMGTFEDVECDGGLDLSSKNDLTALVLAAETATGLWDVLPFFWAPGDGLRDKEDRDRAPYTYWRDHGFLHVSPGKVIDYRYVAKQLGELIERGIRIKALKFDRWRIKDFQRALVEEGIEAWVYGKGDVCDWHEDSKEPMPDGLRLVPHGQGYRDMNPAVEIVEDLLTETRIRHGNHPVLTWCASNTRIQADPAGNRKFDKLKSTGRIDGMVALAMALNGAAGAVKTDNTKSFWETMSPDES